MSTESVWRSSLRAERPLAAEVDVVLLRRTDQPVRGDRGDVLDGPVRRGPPGSLRARPTAGQSPLLERPAPAAQPRPEQLGQLVVIDVPDRGDDQVVGSVVRIPVGAHILDAQRVHGLLGAADGAAEGGLGAEHVGEEGLVAHIGRIVLGHGELLEDDLPLGGQGLLLQQARRDHVREDVHGHRHIGGTDPAVVEGVLLRGDGVGIAADLVEGRGDVHRGAPLGAFEQEVLENMRRPGMLGTLVARSDGQPEPDGRAAHAAIGLGQQTHTAGQDAAPHTGGGIEHHVGGGIIENEVGRHRSIVPRPGRHRDESSPSLPDLDIPGLDPPRAPRRSPRPRGTRAGTAGRLAPGQQDGEAPDGASPSWELRPQKAEQITVRITSRRRSSPRRASRRPRRPPGRSFRGRRPRGSPPRSSDRPWRRPRRSRPACRRSACAAG